MEKRIYGPDGAVARRIVTAGGPSQSTVWKDPDSGRSYVQRTTDAAPALKMAHMERSGDLGALPTGRMMGYMPENDYFALQREAKREAKLAGGGYPEIMRRKMRAYFQENPYLAV